MTLSLGLLSLLAAAAIAAPADFDERQSHPGPIIPKIPGVTVPLSKNAPPLPILQPPTPPIPSKPFKSSKLKPKKIGYFWVGAGDDNHADFLATYSLDDDTFGTFIHGTKVPTSGNSPHHLGPSLDGKALYGGGLLSLLKTQDTGFYFNTTDPYRPTFMKSNRATLASIADEVRAKPDGGFFITYMGSAVGSSPGRLVETDKHFNIIKQHPTNPNDVLSVLKKQFSPHGLTVNYKKGLALTSDFVVPRSILKPTPGVQRADTLRLWNLKTMRILNTITIPNGGGIQDVKFIPGNKEDAAIATAVHRGDAWIIYPHRKDKNGNPGTTELLYHFGKAAKNCVAIYSDISQDGKFAYFTLTTANHIAALDISDLKNIKRLDNPHKSQGIVGPHYIKLAPDQKHLLVTDYFIQPGPISVINTPADFKAQWIDLKKDGSMEFNRFIDFNGAARYREYGGAKPHSAVIFDLTNPKKPKYY